MSAFVAHRYYWLYGRIKMTNGEKWAKWSAFSNVAMAAANFLLLGTSIFALLLVLSELKELRLQNGYLETTMRQTFRPLGVASYDTTGVQDRVFIRYNPAAKPGKFSFEYIPILTNRGKGVLSYLGSLHLISKEEIDFRRDFLQNKIDSIEFDRHYSYARRTPIQPDSKYYTTLICENLDFATRYYLYTLFLYEDQDGALYDTEHLDVLLFADKPKIIPGNIIPDLQGSYIKEKYHTYSGNDKSALIAAIKRYKHPLAEVIQLGH
jgi:hypothetical protein